MWVQDGLRTPGVELCDHVADFGDNWHWNALPGTHGTLRRKRNRCSSKQSALVSCWAPSASAEALPWSDAGGPTCDRLQMCMWRLPNKELINRDPNNMADHRHHQRLLMTYARRTRRELRRLRRGSAWNAERTCDVKSGIQSAVSVQVHALHDAVAAG